VKTEIWIDAISITQTDINERNHQVRQMADNYSNASEVFA
jgi:Heterokaryon incompatibility protein (HET)